MPTTITSTRSFNDQSPADLDAVGRLANALSVPVRMPLRDQDRVLLEGARTFRFGPGSNRHGWDIGEGPLVILVHGYRGRGVQMATLAHAIAKQGFRCIFFDAAGHGASKPEKIGFDTFMLDVSALSAHLGNDIHALIGHSAGALAMMRARQLFDVRAEKYAVISAPFYPYVPLDTFRGRGASDGALTLLKAVLSDQFQTSWSELVAGQSFLPEDGKPLLAIYDQVDDRVDHADADRIAAIWPGAQTFKTSGYGHNRILQADSVINAVRRFLTPSTTKANTEDDKETPWRNT